MFDFGRVVNERGREGKKRQGEAARERAGNFAREGEHQREGKDARQEREQSQRIFRIAERQRDCFLQKQESDGRALVVIERLEESREGTVDDVVRQHGLVQPERAVDEILPQAQDEAREQEGEADPITRGNATDELHKRFSEKFRERILVSV